MKRVFLLIISLFTYEVSNAYCDILGEINIYPTKTDIRDNNLFIIESSGYSQRIIDSLNISYPIYLESEDHKVNLIVKEKNEGIAGISQIILYPSENLQIGKQYILRIENLKESYQKLFCKYNTETRKRKPIVWNVTGKSETNKPQWNQEPELTGIELMQFGCGPEVYTIFNFKAVDDSYIFIKTQLIDLKTLECTTYYLTSSGNNQLKVGRNMCEGPFDYDKDRQYKVRFGLMDGSGNATDNWTSWTTFDSPYNS